jgi:GMP synthase (glutamine-hydrolysing)
MPALKENSIIPRKCQRSFGDRNGDFLRKSEFLFDSLCYYGKMPKENRRRPVLIVQHAPHEHPAVVKRTLESQGIQTLLLHSYLGDHYPSHKEIQGMISLGGPMNANDESNHPWLKEELKLLRACVLDEQPVAGICLGGQLMARAMGGSVEKNSTLELGWFPIEINSEGQTDPITGSAGGNPTVYQWHEDTFHLPKEAILLASSPACPRQAYRIGEKAYGFQFHPEADHQLVNEWLDIEGVEDEILEAQRLHGGGTIQDGKTQRNVALKGEKASLRITAAIGSLFRRRAYDEDTSDKFAQFESFATHQATLIFEIEGPDRKVFQLRGQITAMLSVAAGDFVLLKEPNTLVWPIRIDDVLRVKLA